MEVLVVSHELVRDLLPMNACMDAVAAALRAHARGETVLPLRSILWQPDRRGALGVMPAWLGEPQLLGVKVISVFPVNESTKYESHQGTVMLFEVEHGRLVAIIDAGEITAIRTAAASGVATRALAREDASDLAILGTGAQAKTHLEAMRVARPISRVRLWGRKRDKAERLAAGLGGDVEVMDTAEDAVAGADIVCTLTGAREPILRGEWLSPGAHVNAVGACIPSARELDTRCMEMARLIVDCRESAENEAGDFLIAKAEGAIDDDHIVGELGAVLEGTVVGRTAPDEITVFESLGVGIEDLAAADVVYRAASKRGVGERVAIGGLRG